MKRKERKEKRIADFEVIVSHYEGRLIRYVTRIVNSEDIAQDVVQDSFIRLFRKWKDILEPGPKISSWLYRVAHNRAVDHIRKQSRKSELHKRHAIEQPEFIAPNRGDAFRIGDKAAMAAIALNTLNERERQLVILKVYEEKSYKEISEIMGITSSNVGYILHHTLKKLAKVLKEAKVQ